MQVYENYNLGKRMKKLSFEQKVQKVQDIIQSINKNEAPLNELMGLYEEAKKYLHEANLDIENAKMKITDSNEV